MGLADTLRSAWTYFYLSRLTNQNKLSGFSDIYCDNNYMRIQFILLSKDEADKICKEKDALYKIAKSKIKAPFHIAVKDVEQWASSGYVTVTTEMFCKGHRRFEGDSNLTRRLDYFASELQNTRTELLALQP